MFAMKTSSQKVKRIYYNYSLIIVLILLEIVNQVKCNPPGSIGDDSVQLSGIKAKEMEKFDILTNSNETLVEPIGHREKTKKDDIFTYCSAALVIFMFMNLGTVLDIQRLKSILMRPIGALVGFCSRYLLMPALCIGLGFLLLRDRQELQIALFLTGLAPSGGIANICIIFLKANINLSLTITTLNSLMALAMFPFWILFLAPIIFEHTNVEFVVPFVNLVITSVALIVSIAIGVALRMCIPRTTRFIFRLLKPLSILLSLALIGLTIGMNAFIFKELTPAIVLIAFILPVLGYLLSFGLSKILCRSLTDSMTISIETSVINMTIPILLLQYSLEAATVERAVVIPVITSLVSLILVLVFYIVRRIFGWNRKIDDDCFDERQLLIEGQQ